MPDLRVLDDETKPSTPSDPPQPEPNPEVDRRYLELRRQLVDAAGLRNIPPPIPLVEGWLYKDSLAWIQGKWSNGKSFVAVDIGCCVATGIAWHGFNVAQSTVLYLIAEGVSGLSQRVDAWEAANSVEATGIVFLPVPVQMADPKGVDLAAFRMLLSDIKPGLVIIDTQARVTVGAEENSSKDMGIFVDALDILRRESGATMLPVHHEPRTGENLRGSVALEGAADTVIKTNKDGDEITISNPKQKNTQEQSDIILTLHRIGKSAALFRGISGEGQALTPTDQKLLEVLGEFPGAQAPVTIWLETSGVPKASFYRSRNKLVRKDRVIESKQGNATICHIPDALPPETDETDETDET
jgi:hypothetical protein